MQSARSIVIERMELPTLLGREKELCEAGYSAKAKDSAKVKDCFGVSVEDLERIYTLKEWVRAGFIYKKSKKYMVDELRAAGYTAKELKGEGFNVHDLNGGGYTVKQLKEAGFAARDVKSADKHVTLQELKNAGYNYWELQETEYTVQELPTLLGMMPRFPSGKSCSKDIDSNDITTRSNNEKGLRKIQPAALCRMILTTDDVFCHQDSDLYQMICKVAEQLAHSGLPEALEFMRPILDPTVDGTLDLTSNGPERWFVTSWKKQRMKRQQKQGVPVTTIIHLQLLKGELRDRVHTAQSCGDISSPGMHSTIIELTLPGFDRVESKLKITTNSIDTRNLLHMAVLLLNEVYLMEDALWHDVCGVSSEEDEMTRLVTLLRGYGSDLTSRGEQLISFLQRTKGTDKNLKMREKTWKADNVHAETDALALEAWNLWANARKDKLPEERDQSCEKAAKSVELAIIQAMKHLLNLHELQNCHGKALLYAKKIARIEPTDQEIEEKIKKLNFEIERSKPCFKITSL